ncbi:MAG: GNAT family N-acetyltransferase [Planctomycetota bacterium]|nr:GNAT family N-acetyltransferase [Planctomycetota bacterium]
MTTAIRNAQKGDRDALVSISIRTIRASYISFLGVEAVEGWLAGGTVEAYFDQHRPDCRVLEESGESVGFCVVRGALIDLMMIDCERHREGFGRTLLDHVESDVFKVHPVLRLVSFVDNQSANAFYAARGWTSGEPFEDRSPNDGPPSPPN